MYAVQFFNVIIPPDCTTIDVYNMQLSNQPAEALAKKLVDTSGGAFTLCGFASGGLFLFSQLIFIQECLQSLGSEAMESALKLARQVFFYLLLLIDTVY